MGDFCRFARHFVRGLSHQLVYQHQHARGLSIRARAIIRHPKFASLASELRELTIVVALGDSQKCFAGKVEDMTMTYSLSETIEPIFLTTPVRVPIEPTYPPRRAVTPSRSASDLRWAATMLAKLQRREEINPSLWDSAAPYDSDRVIDAVVEKLLDE